MATSIHQILENVKEPWKEGDWAKVDEVLKPLVDPVLEKIQASDMYKGLRPSAQESVTQGIKDRLRASPVRTTHWRQLGRKRTKLDTMQRRECKNFCKICRQAKERQRRCWLKIRPHKRRYRPLPALKLARNQKKI